ncbi:PhnA domain-containing protein [Mucilaginibacter psychrotolerans]|uniref:PhnA protein n=1 Tax=Mucilaginibacter psychrotolerans TaxID=1524096 RepID=A0A4Y8S7L0_9SPHI|nr:alkylphosphonate utilization protein [Mucilaginibacter psychrotolerans]TFF34591.1 PhnA protein [Mucilaginibacter psychrotolerans]
MSTNTNAGSPEINTCELCRSASQLAVYQVPPAGYAANEINVCPACLAELAKTDKPDSRYWRFLAEAMWSDVPAVQVLSWRILSLLNDEDWAAACLDMLYLDDEQLAWAKAGFTVETAEPAEVHRDSLGNELQSGDTVVLTRSLDVKGSSLNAKMGTVVKNIRLVGDNTEQIEGKIDGQTIVILTKYLRRQKS